MALAKMQLPRAATWAVKNGRQAASSLRARSMVVRAMSAAATPTPLHILGVSGSLRKGSSNTGLLRAAQRNLPAGVTMDIADISEIPIYNDDLWAGKADDSALAPALRKFRAQVAGADAIIFGCPEYNFSIASPLKTALDWGSKNPNVFDGKPAAIMGAGGGAGTARAQYHLRQVGVFLNIHFINRPEIQIKRFENMAMFDAETGDLNDAKVEGWVGAQVKELVAWTRKLKA